VTYQELKDLVAASGTLEAIPPTAIADALAGSLWDHVRTQRELDENDVRLAAAAAFELGRLGLQRDTFLSLIRVK
jgi:hypothetical protein